MTPRRRVDNLLLQISANLCKVHLRLSKNGIDEDAVGIMDLFFLCQNGTTSSLCFFAKRFNTLEFSMLKVLSIRAGSVRRLGAHILPGLELYGARSFVYKDFVISGFYINSCCMEKNLRTLTGNI